MRQLSLGLTALPFAIFALATPAAASTINYTWTGIVDHIVPGSVPAVTLGQQIKIKLSLDNTVADSDASATRGEYDAITGFPPELVVSVSIGGITDIGFFQFGTVQANDGGVDGFEIDTGDPMLGDRFDIKFSTTHPGVLTSDALPLSIDPADFEHAVFSVNQDGPLASFLPAFSGRIVSSVPLPGALGMFGIALAGLFGFRGYGVRRARSR